MLGKNGEWISVEDSLPKEGQNVILYDGNEVFCGNIEMDCKKKPYWGTQPCDGICYGWYNKNEIKYWMPLPEKPKE